MQRGQPCPFKHPGREQVDDALSSEQHSAILSYAEAKGKDPCDVSWSAVAADGEGKWIAAGKKQMAVVEGNQRPRMYPVLERRSKVSSLDRGCRASYTDATKWQQQQRGPSRVDGVLVGEPAMTAVRQPDKD